MQSDGRFEKRVAVKLPVHLLPAENALVPEAATTLNINRYGARVSTNRRWRPGDQVDLISISGEFKRRATVIYCHPSMGGQFSVGLEFDVNVKNIECGPWTSVA